MNWLTKTQKRLLAVYHFDIYSYTGPIPRPVEKLLILISLTLPGLIVLAGFMLNMPELNNFTFSFVNFSESFQPTEIAPASELLLNGSPSSLWLLMGIMLLGAIFQAILAPLDLLVRARNEQQAVAWKDCFVFSLGSSVIIGASFLILDTRIAQWLIQACNWFFNSVNLVQPLLSIPFILLVILVYFLDDVFFYIGHRLSHKVRFMWKLGHMQHHRPTNLTTATQMADFSAFFLNGGGGSFVAKIIGYTFFLKLFSEVEAAGALTAAFIIAILRLINHTMSHSYATYMLFSKNRFLRALEKVFVTGRIHYVHHSKLPEHNVAAGCNFAAQFTFIDRLMGTYAEPSYHIPPTGLFHEDRPPGNPLKVALDQWVKLARELYLNSPKHWHKILFADPAYEPPVPA